MHYHNKEKTVRDRENKGNGNHNMMDAGHIVVKEIRNFFLYGKKRAEWEYSDNNKISYM